jgi:hypothetical protein
MSLAKVKQYSAISGIVIGVLVLIAVIALLEEGPPRILLYIGPSPLNTGPIGTSALYYSIKQFYLNTHIVLDWSMAEGFLGGLCGRAIIIIVSPEVPYSDKDLEYMKRIVSSCSEVSFLIADESVVSNEILRFFGSSIRITGSIILNVDRSFYPEAELKTLWGWEDRVLLDIPSKILVGNGSALGYIDSGILITGSNFILESDIVVSAFERIENLNFYVIGDGSIFLNQVLDSEYGSTYRSLLFNIVNGLCNNDFECIVLLDGSKYRGLDPVKILENPPTDDPLIVFLMQTPEFLSSVIARTIHPASWLPQFINIMDYRLRILLEEQPIFKGVAAGILTYLILSILYSRESSRVFDRSIRDDGPGIISSLRDLRIYVNRRISYNAEDYRSFYIRLNKYIESIFGVEIADPRFTDYLTSLGLSRSIVERFRRNAIKYMNIADGRARIPRIVRWNKAILKV